MDRFPDVEWQPKRLIVLAPDPDHVVTANYVDVMSFIRKSHRIGKRPQPIFDLSIGPQGRETGLLLHCVAQTIVVEEILARVPAEIKNSRKNHKLDHTAQLARSPSVTAGRWNHH